MFSKLKLGGRLVVGALIIIPAIYGVNYALDRGYMSSKPSVPVAVPDKINLPPATVATASPVSTTVMNVASASATIRVKTIPWNGTLGMMHAKASGAFSARGLNVDIKREDDYAKLIADMAAQAKDPNSGSHFVVIMGDGLGPFIIGLNEALKPFGQSAKKIGGIGYSRGEDKCILWDGAEIRGSVIAGYLGDGDINICIKRAADDGIPVNADPKIYDPNAMNFVGTGSFVEADDKFIASARMNFKGGACEDRKHSVTGKIVNVCVNGTATWFPGDEKVFLELKKLGLSIKVIGSTMGDGHSCMKTGTCKGEYAWQMPTAVIGNVQWMAANRAATLAFLATIYESGEKVRTDNGALMIAAAEQAKVTREHDASHWGRAFKGFDEVGPNGKVIHLGGSTTNGLADAAYLFGLNGADDLFNKVYTVYGKIAVQYFPDIMPGGLLPYDKVVDKSFVQELLNSSSNIVAAATPTFTGVTTETFAVKSVSIEFETGKATFTPKAVRVLNDLLDQAAVTALSVQINGHTDKHGNDDDNMRLSKDRADAVKQFFMTNAPKTFPTERIITRGFGETQPIGTDAQNRRVEIILRK